MNSIENKLKIYINQSTSRIELWVKILKYLQVHRVAEIGVYKGDFASAILSNYKAIETYYAIDPWRYLEDWNKPMNKNNDFFDQCYEETITKTKFAGERVKILRGKTDEVADKIQDNSLDFIYIDGDHTLKGVTIDLNIAYRKLQKGGIIGGDDFRPSIWQHFAHFEPTFVFPYAVYFAEAVNAQIYALPYDQFLIHKIDGMPFKFIDFTGNYSDTSIQKQLNILNYLKLRIRQILSI